MLSGFLFGYEDELACILDGNSGTTPEEAKDTKEEEEEEWVDWNEEDNDEQEEKVKTTLDGIPSYRLVVCEVYSVKLVHP
jgi:hypothetical protein